MQKKKFLIGITIFIWVIFLFDFIAQVYFLYWRFWWTDIIMHFMGGFWVALFGYYIFYLSDYREKLKTITQKYSLLIISFSFVLGIGILWELFELIFAFPLRYGYLFDTVLDLIMDVFGCLVAYLLVLKKVGISQKSIKSIKSKV
ncbi:MAG: hypothetical protein KAJ58_01055 [Candidatus Pacebacteria bacterium]|nr:hypothetical protein [Candidatus Paceibacterota bacterium]